MNHRSQDVARKRKRSPVVTDGESMTVLRHPSNKGASSPDEENEAPSGEPGLINGEGAVKKLRGGAEGTTEPSAEAAGGSDVELQPIVPKWSQDGKTVTITLPVCNVRTSEVNLTIDGQDVTLNLPDGRSWSCSLHAAVESADPMVICTDELMAITLSKQEKYKKWPALTAKDPPPEADSNHVGENHASDNMEVSDGTNHVGEEGRDSPTKLGVEESEGPGVEFVHLQQLRHDWFERGSDLMCLYVFTKEVCKDTLDIQFSDQALTVNFQTGDSKFLALHEGTTTRTIFCWSIRLFYRIVPDECVYRVGQSTLDITLKKADVRRWTRLEALSNTSSGPSASGVSNWKPLSAAGSVSQEAVSQPAVTKKPPPPPPAPPPTKLSQKPTCLVPPVTHGSWGSAGDMEQTCEPGFTGLDNLGNTCFMNATLQALANTRELRDFCQSNKFKDDLNTENVLGSGGKLAIAFACVLRTLWSGTRTSYAPSRLKSIIATKAHQFTGFAQHDAQEFLAFLLDGLHEDLNRIQDKPYTSTVESDGRPDWEVADDAWRVYMKRNDSFMVDLFHGQFKSTLVCPACSKVSVTFDPFAYLSVPLPKKQRTLSVYFQSRDPANKPVLFSVPLAVDAAVEDLKLAIARRTDTKAQNLRVFEVYKSGIHFWYNRGDTLSNVQANDHIMVCEVLDQQQAGEAVYEVAVLQRCLQPLNRSPITRCTSCQKISPDGSNMKRCTKCFKAGYCNQQCQKKHWPTHKSICKYSPEPIGCPFIISLPQSQATFTRLCQMLEAFARYSVDVFQPPIQKNTPASSSESSAPSEEPAASPVNQEDTPGNQPQPITEEEEQRVEEKDASESEEATTPREGEPKMAVVHGQQQDPPPERDILPFFLKPCNERGQGKVGPDGERLQDQGNVPLDLSDLTYLAMDWRNHEKSKNYVLVQSKLLEYEEDESVHSTPTSDGPITLQQCLQLFTEPETLAPEEAWYCPGCKQHREATKQMSLWRLPHTLIIQLKRFSFRNLIWRDKITKMVQFPLTGLDMSGYCGSDIGPGEAPPIYDLYATVDHHGGLLGGHYTAYAQLPDASGSSNAIGWRLFDDSHVRAVHETEVMRPSAYLLFYRLRGADVHASAPEKPLNSNNKAEGEETSPQDGPEDQEMGTPQSASSSSNEVQDSISDDDEEVPIYERPLQCTDLDEVD
ncbi:ubiquitin carboxyl-terminal hydrolase 19-like [Branchiostoma lanceolatum]|uniref:ubiquitin carboxyl-terminal hydrolase 19-like n=1 Tax=Branchiostoma lanceolatum TaxID=7740 RepID=UPI003452A67C